VDPQSNEAGGILLGRIMEPELLEAWADDATVPSNSDRRSRFRFWRAKKPTQLRIDSAWQTSDGTNNYLGEWHTHPEDNPTPSGEDRRNWQRLSRQGRFEQNALFFVIVGKATIGAWEVPRGGGELQALRHSDISSSQDG
jgi:integrative and conjugative element protein (TIGR02256 family)